MPFLPASAFLLLIAYPMTGSDGVVWVLLGSQLSLLVGQIWRGQATGVGAFIFFSVLFFGIRPVYAVLETDFSLMTSAYLLRPTAEMVGSAMWWATLAMLFFALGAHFAPRGQRKWIQKRRKQAAVVRAPLPVTNKMVGVMLAVQLLTMPLIYSLSSAGRMLYKSAAGAYIYELPIPLQALHMLAVLIMADRWLRNKTVGNLLLLGFSGVLFLAFTWLMRDVSLFRTFYLSGVMMLGLALLHRYQGRVSLIWLIIPFVVLQPLLRHLGGERHKVNEELVEEGIVAREEGRQETLAQAYWNFYRSNGDMNIFDTFVASTQAQPRFRPYLVSWLYVPVHFVPRALWPGKPKQGITQDLRFLRGLPTSPGIAGFFLMDGGFLWMLGCMFVLGYLLCLLDCYVLTMRPGYLQACYVGIIVVCGMLLSRFLLWQYFYQVLYAMIPVAALAWFFQRTQAFTSTRGRRIRPLLKTEGTVQAH